MGDLKEILKDITDFEKEKFSIVNLPNKYENYIYINLAILYKLVYDDDDKIVFDNNIIDKIKNYMFKSICNYLSSYTKLNDDYSTTIEYIKQKYKDIECETSPPIAEKEVDVVEDVNVVKEVDEEVKEEVIFSVNKNTPFTITAIGDNEYKIKLIKDSANDITGFEENVRVTKDTNGYYLILKHNDNTELYIYQYQQQDNKLKFKIVHPSNSIMYEVSINTDDEHTIEFTSGNKSDKNDENVLLLILLYFCQFNYSFNIYHKNFFEKILDLNQDDEILIKWREIFGYFGYELNSQITKLKDIREPDKDVPKKMKFIGKNKEFTISKIEDKSDEFNADFDHNIDFHDDCDKDKLTFKVKKPGDKYYLQLNDNIQVQKFTNDSKIMIYNNNNNEERRINIYNNSIIINENSSNLSDYTNNNNELLLILLYAVLNDYDIKPSNIGIDFKKLQSLMTKDNNIYCYWKKIFKYFDKNLDEFLKIIDNYHARYKFAIANNLEFKLENGNKLILTNNNCKDIISNELEDDKQHYLTLDNNNLKISVNDNLYFIIKQDHFNSYKLTFNINNSDNIELSIQEMHQLQINDYSINNFINIHKKDILFLILLFLYLKEDKENLKDYYSKFYELIDYQYEHKWKDIFCSFGITNNDFNELMINIKKSNEETKHFLDEQNKKKQKISKHIVTLSESTENINQNCSDKSAITTNVWKVDSFKDTHAGNFIDLDTRIHIYIDTNLKNISVKINNQTSTNYILQEPVNNEYTYKKCHSTDDDLYTLYTIVFNAHNSLLEQGKYLKFPKIDIIFNSTLEEPIKSKLIKSLYFSNVDDYGFYVDKNKIKDDKNIDEYAVYYFEGSIKHFPNINKTTYKIVYDNLFQNVIDTNNYLLINEYLVGNEFNKRKIQLSIKNYLYYYDTENNVVFIFNNTDNKPLKIENININKSNPQLSTMKNYINFYTKTDDQSLIIAFQNNQNELFYFNENGYFYKTSNNYGGINIYKNIDDDNDIIPPIYESLELLKNAYNGRILDNIIFKLGSELHTFINGNEHFYNGSVWNPYITQQVIYQRPLQEIKPTGRNIYFNGILQSLFINESTGQYFVYYNGTYIPVNVSGGGDDEGEKIFNAILVYIFNKLIMLGKASLKDFFKDLKTS